MAKITIKKASTDVTLYVFIQASNVTTGAGLTGLTFETASLVASYVRPLAARAALTLATQTVTGAHSDGGFVEVDATNMPGVYRLDLSDAVCATGVGSVVVMLKGAANMAPLLLEIQLVSYDPNDGVRLGITALPNAAADEAGGLPISDAGGLDLDAQIKTDIDAILADTGTDGVKLAVTQGAITWAQQKIVTNVAGEGALDIRNNNATGLGINIFSYKEGINSYSFKSHGIAAIGGIGGTGAGIRVKSDVGDGVVIQGATNGVSITGTTKNVSGFDTDIATAAALATVDGIVDSILADTGTDGVVLANDAITAAKFDESTAFPLKSADTGATAVARTGADSDTLETLSDQLDAIDDYVDTEVAAIKAKTDNLPSDPADQSAVEAAIIAGIGTIPAGITAEDVMTAIVEGAVTLRDSLKLANAMNAGKVSGGNTAAVTFRDLADTLDRIIMTVDEDGNRTAVAKDYS